MASAKKHKPSRAKPRKRSPKAKLTPKQRRFVEVKVTNPLLSDREAARQAGYKAGTVQHTTADIVEKPAVQAAFRALLNRAVSDDALVSTIRAGLSATTTEFAKHEGEITDERELIAWSERRAYAELACRLKGLIRNWDDQDQLGEIRITIRHVAGSGVSAPAQTRGTAADSE